MIQIVLRKRATTVRKTVLKVILSIIIILIIKFFFLLINSPGKLDPLSDEYGKMIPDAITEKSELEIGGIKQGFFIRSENAENPVILFLHGGPGNPELPFIISHESDERLEKYFTVCYWEQRGAGMSYNNSIDTASMTIEQMVEDTREMTEYLQRRFNKKKIYLMGHSWGSYLGVKTIEKYPQNYLAYIGISQVTNQVESELLAYDYILEQAIKINDKKTIKKLEKFDKNAPDFPNSDYLMSIGISLMDQYGIGTMHKDYSIYNMVTDVLLFEGYTLADKINYICGSMFSLEHVFPYIMTDNLFESSKSFDIPIYVIQGEYDYQTSYTLAKKYIETIEAPEKGFFSFENSAHSPNMEEPKRFVQIVREIDTLISLINIKSLN